MNRVTGLILCGLLCGCAQTMQIDAVQYGTSRASLRIESPDLAEEDFIPLIGTTVVNVSLSKFAGCEASPQLISDQENIGKATLTPSKNSQIVEIPAELELAVFAQSVKSNMGGNFTCGMAARFQSEPNKTYVLRFKNKGSCDMEVLDASNGKETPVESVHYAALEYQGFFSGNDLNLCK